MRRRILDAARDVFTSEGYDRVTMRAVAEAIEYSPTAIYNHFVDKNDLLQSLCEEDFLGLLTALAQEPRPEDPVEWVRALGRSYARFALEYPNHYRFMFMTPSHQHHHDHDAGLKPGAQSFEMLRKAVTAAIESGRFRGGDATHMSQVLWANIHGAASLLITIEPAQWPLAPPDPELVEQVLETGLRGMCATPRD